MLFRSLGEAAYSEVRDVMLDIPRDESLAVYPNPVEQVLYIRNLMAYESDASVHLYSASGVLMHTLNIPAGSMMLSEVPMANLPAGIYLVRILFGDGETRTVKVSKF